MSLSKVILNKLPSTLFTVLCKHPTGKFFQLRKLPLFLSTFREIIMNIILKPLPRRILPTVATLSLLGLLSLSTQGNAATSTFTDSASFFAALPGPSSTQDYEGVPAESVIPNGATLDGINYSSNVGGGSLFISTFSDTTSGNNSLGGDDNFFLSGDELSFGFSSLTQAIGLFIIDDIEPGSIVENDIQLIAGGLSVFNLATPERILPDRSNVFFLGLIDTDGFDSAQLLSFGDPSDPFFIFNVDDVTTVALNGQVPEPSSYLLLSLGLLMLGKKMAGKKNVSIELNKI